MPSRINLILCFLFSIHINVARGQVVAGFTVDVTAGCVPLVVHFTNTSIGATSYTWDFGNGSNATAINPSLSYLATGNHTVTLTAYSGTATATYQRVINVYPPPTVDFSAAVTAICPGTPVHYNNHTMAGAPGPVSYSWNFGDGGGSNATAPDYAHGLPGFYNINLIATNSAGCTSGLNKPAYVQVYPRPTAAFSVTGSLICHPPSIANFTNGSTGLAPLTYSWSFGDGGAATALNPGHSYVADGSYDVSLRVSDVHGCRDSASTVGMVTVAAFTSSIFAPPGVCDSGSILFANSSPGYVFSNWSFGDGILSATDTPAHTYALPGTYIARLVTGNGVCQDTALHTVTVHPKPDPQIEITPGLPCSAPVTVNYQTTLAAGGVATWIFYDSDADTGQSVNFSYDTGRIANTVLTVTDSNGCTASTDMLDTIYSLRPSIFATAKAGCIPLNTSFYCPAFTYILIPGAYSAQYIPTPYTISGYTWDFGDGSPISSASSPAHVYTAVGVYTVRCTVATTSGCLKSETMVVRAGVPPSATFTATPTVVCAGRVVSFVSSVTDTVTDYSWRMGDGTVLNDSNLQAVSYRYKIPGDYAASLTVAHNGCPSITTYVNIHVDSPSAIPTYAYMCIPNNGIQFGDSSLGADTRLWDFGDGSTSTLKNPAHYYPAKVTYIATLSTYNAASGCRDTFRNIVNLTQLGVNISVPDPTACVGEEVLMSAEVGGRAVSRHRWYADGVMFSDSTFPIVTHSFYTGGLHDLMVAVKNHRGCYDTAWKNQYVRIGSPRDSFELSSATGCAPLNVSFANYSSGNPASPLVAYYWSYGDGGFFSSAGPAAAHVYTSSGVFTVTQWVQDSLGCVSPGYNPREVTVHKPATYFETDVADVCLGQSVHFDNLTPGIVSSNWHFGDGITSTTNSPDHTYGSIGLYDVQLAVADSFGCRDSVLLTNFINVLPIPHAAFTVSDSFAVCPPLDVSFLNGSTGGSANYWIFGNGPTSVLTNPINPYSVPGSYTAELVVQNVLGCNDTARQQIAIFGYPGGFTYLPHNGCDPLAVNFYGSFGAGVSKIWDFGDGSVSSGATADTASHVYTTGSYLPTLILTDNAGCSNFSVGTDTVHVAQQPGPITGPLVLCQGSSSAFGNAVGGGTWSVSNMAVATVDAGGVVTALAPGVTLVRYATSASCVAERLLTVHELPDTIAGLKSICEGQYAFLSNATAGGVWMADNPIMAPVSASGVVTGVGSGVFVISYALMTGCARTAEVTVNAVPGAINGSLYQCAGVATLLTATLPGGIWSSSDTAIVVIDAASGVYTGVAYGTAIITYDMGHGCATYAPVTIDATPPAILGGPTVCAGFAVNLSNAMHGGVWSSDPATMGVGTIHSITGVVSGITPGTITVWYTSHVGCVTSLVVTVLPLPPVISGLPDVCVGSSIMQGNGIAGGTWTSGNITTANVGLTTGVVTGVSAGVVVVTYTIPTGCFNIRHITVNPLPAILSGPVHVCEGATVAMTGSPSGGIWETDDIAIASAGIYSGVVTGMGAGIANVTYKVPTGCIATTALTVDVSPPAITGNHYACMGSVSLLSNSLPGGTWVSSNPSVATVGSLSGLVTPVTIGISTVSYQLPVTGCYAVTTLTVQPLPVPFHVTGGGAYCAGGPGVHIGTDSSQTGVSYVLHYGASVTGYMSGTGFPIDFGALMPPGIYTVSATEIVSGCHATMFGSAHVTITEPVEPGVDIVAVPGTSLCEGLPVALSTTYSHGGTAPSFSWKVNGVAVSSVPVYSFIPADGDHVTVTMISNDGCVSSPTATAHGSLTVLPYRMPEVIAEIKPGDTICWNQPVKLIAHSFSGGDDPEYMWLQNGIVTGSGKELFCVPSEGETIFCRMAGNYLCSLADTVESNHIHISVDTSIIPRVTIIPEPGLAVAEGLPVTLKTTVWDAGPLPAYNWRVNGKPVPGATNSVYSSIFQDYDSVVCMVTSSGRCEGITSFDWVFITVSPLATGQQHLGANTFAILPNPNKGNFRLIGKTCAQMRTDVLVQIMTATGRQVYARSFQSHGGVVNDLINLDEEIANGMYYISIISCDATTQLKFVLMR